MRKEQVDLANKLVFIADSKTPTGVAELPLTDIAAAAFKSQLEIAGPGLGSFRVRKARPGIRPTPRRPGSGRCEKLAYRTSGYMISGLPTRLASVRSMMERFRRVNFGRLEIEVTIDDPKVYTKPWR